MGDTRPKLEIVRTDDGVEFHLDGKCLDETRPDRNPCYAAESIAKSLGRALGADVVDADEPTRQPYRYFVAYAVFLRGWRGWFIGGRQIVGSRWFDLDQDIDGPDDTRRLAEIIAADIPGRVIVTITGITYIDGPC